MSKITIIVAGETGSGKSAIAGEIEIALKAVGVPVQWKNADREWWQKGNEYWIDLYKPEVTIIESNIPVKEVQQLFRCTKCGAPVAMAEKPKFCPYCRSTEFDIDGRRV